MPPEPRPPSAAAGLAAITGAAVLWSTGGLFIKLAPLPGAAVTCGRAAVTTLFYLAVLRPDLRRARWSTSLAYAGMIVSFVLATKMTTAANAVFLQFTGPAYVLVLAPRLLGERFQRLDALCVVLSLAGLGLVFLDRVGAGQMAGNLLGAASGVFYAFTVVLLRRDAPGPGGAMASVTLGNIVAAAVTLPFAVPHFEAALAPRALGVLLYLGVVQVGLGYILFERGVRRVPAATASVVNMLEPVLNPVWVFLVAGERPGPWALAGGTVVLCTVGLRAALTAR